MLPMIEPTHIHNNLTGYRALFRSRPFAMIWIGTLLSLMGDSIGIVAVVTIVQTLSGHSSLAMTIYYLIRDLVPLFVMIPSGICADRWDQRKIMLWSDLGRMLIVLGYMFYLLWPSPGLIYIVLIFHVALSSFYYPALQSYIPKVVERPLLILANILDNVTYSLVLMVGSAVGGWLLYIGSPLISLTIDSSSYFLSSMITLILICKFPLYRRRVDLRCLTDLSADEIALTSQSPPEDSLNPIEPPTLRQLGLYLREHPDTIWLSLFKSVGNLANGIVNVLSISYAHHRFTIASSFSLTISFGYLVEGFGCFLIPVVVRIMVENTTAMRKCILLGFGSMTIGLLCITFSYHIAIWLVGLFLFSFGNSLLYVFIVTIIQSENPPQIQGRLFAISYATRAVSHAIGTVISGLLLVA